MTQFDFPIVRVGIDWDNDRQIDWGVSREDAPNLLERSPLLSNYTQTLTHVVQDGIFAEHDYFNERRYTSGISTEQLDLGRGDTIYKINDTFTDGEPSKYGYRFIPSVNMTVTDVVLRIGAMALDSSPSADSIRVRIETDSSGSPSGTAITNGSVTVLATALPQFYNMAQPFLQDYTFTFSGTVSLTAGTTYWFVIDKSVVSGLDFWYRIASALDVSGTHKYKDFVTGLWTSGKPLWWRFNGTSNGHQIMIGKNTVADEIAVDPSTQYTLAFKYRNLSGATNKSFDLKVFNQSNSQLGSTVTTTFSSADWTDVTLTFTTGVSDTFIYWTLTRTDTPAAATSFALTAWMLVEGIVVPEFNTGVVSLYEDVTDFVLAFQTKNGRNGPMQLVPSEGAATITLNNQSRIFSPEYESGPLFGNFKSGNVVQIQVLHPDTDEYEVIWSGIIDSITPDTSQYSSTQTKIECLQGFFSLSETNLQLDLDNETTYTIDEILTKIVSKGWTMPGQLSGVYIDHSAFDHAFFTDAASLFDAETADTSLDHVGDGWAEGTTSPLRAITDLMEVEQGWFWFQRDGVARFRNRLYYEQNPTPVIDFSLNDAANAASYSFGKYVANKTKVTVYPKDQVAATLWKTRPYVKVPARNDEDGKPGKKEITAKFEYEEGARINSVEINAFDAVDEPSTYEAFDYSNTITLTSRVEVIVTKKGNSEAKIKILNHGRRNVKVYITLKGIVDESFGGESYDLVDTASVEDNQVHAYKDLDLKLVTDAEVAQDIGWFILSKYATPYGNFDKLKIIARSEDWLADMLDTSLGDLITTSDYQQGDEDQKHVIIGEEWEFTPGNLAVSYNLQRIAVPGHYWRLGTSALGTDTYVGF